MPFHFSPGSYSSPRSGKALPFDEVDRGLPLNATIVRRSNLNEGLALITVQLDGWQAEPFEPGQYADIALQRRSGDRQAVSLTSLPSADIDRIRRSYSIVSAPDRLDRLEFLFNLVPTGSFTPGLWRLDEGSRLHVQPRIRGRFTLAPVPREADLLLLATGTGIAPYISMLRHYRDARRWHRAALIHSVRHARDLAFRGELEQLADADEGFRYLPTVTRSGESVEWSGEERRIPALLEDDGITEQLGFRLDPETTHVLLCGNPKMIQRTIQQLEPAGFTHATRNTPGTLHTESYW